VAGEQFDFILANINRNILISMMPSFSALLPTEGLLLMSGFLREDVPYIEASAMEQGFTVENIIEREGWMVVVCKKM
jgi:ribosomal protein L11 methyltransferase